MFTVLSARKLQLSGNITPLLELASGTNDPMAVFLTIGLIDLLVSPQATMLDFIVLFVQQMGVGTLCGLGLGWLAMYLVDHIDLEVVL